MIFPTDTHHVNQIIINSKISLIYWHFDLNICVILIQHPNNKKNKKIPIKTITIIEKMWCIKIFTLICLAVVMTKAKVSLF